MCYVQHHQGQKQAQDTGGLSGDGDGSPVWRMQLGWNRQLGADEKDVGRLPDVTRARIL